MDATSVASVLAAVGSGTMAGIFFVFSVFAMRALDELPVDAAVAAMQQINLKILNPLFMLVFAGTAVVSIYLLVAGVDESTGADRAARLGAVCYLLGVIVVTMTRNVPMNNRLARVAIDGDDSGEAHTVWPWYRRVWTGWNHLRTVASIGATVCFCLTLTL